MKEWFKIIIPIFIIIGLMVWGTVSFSFNDHTYKNVKVIEKQVKRTNDTEKYLIFAEIEGKVIVFENTDELFRAKFDSSTVYGNIKVGETYNFTVVGHRIPFLSMYENIIDIE